MDKQRLSFLGISIVGIISSFLPWISYGWVDPKSSYGTLPDNILGFQTIGHIALYAFVLMLILSLVGHVSQKMSNSLKVTQLILGVVALISVLTVLFTKDSTAYGHSKGSEAMKYFAKYIGDFLKNISINYGFGIWFALLAAIAAIVVPFAVPERLTGASFNEFFAKLAGLFRNPNPRPTYAAYGQAAFPGQAPVQQPQAPVQPAQPAQAAFPGQAPVQQPQTPVQPVQPAQPVFPGQAPVQKPQAPVQPVFPGQEPTEPVNDQPQFPTMD